MNLTERTYTNADGTKVVPEDSPEAAFLLGVEGDEIDDERAKALGIKAPKAEAKPVESDAPPAKAPAKAKNAGGLAKP